MSFPRSTKPGRSRLAIPIVATAALGTALFYRTRTSSDKTPRGDDLRKQRATEGLSGAGLAGSDFPSGGAHQDVPRTDAPRDMLPSGGVGAGEGGGSTNARAVDLFPGNKADGSAYSSQGDTSDLANQQPAQQRGSRNESKPSNDGSPRPGTSSMSQGLQHVFGVGGKSAGEPGESNRQRMYSDTRSLSEDHEAPSKKSPKKTQM